MAGIVDQGHHQASISCLENVDGTDILLHLPEVGGIEAEERAEKNFAYHLVGYKDNYLVLVLRQDPFECANHPIFYILKALSPGKGDLVWTTKPLAVQLAILL